MKNIISNLAFTWAIICTLLILMVIICAPQLAKESEKLSFMKISPMFSGGDLNYSFEKDSMITTVYKPVFQALIGEGDDGFVQIKFSGNKKALHLTRQEIDYNNDSKPDFDLKIDTLKNITEFLPLNTDVKSLVVSSKVKNNWIVRVKVKNTKQK